MVNSRYFLICHTVIIGFVSEISIIQLIFFNHIQLNTINEYYEISG